MGIFSRKRTDADQADPTETGSGDLDRSDDGLAEGVELDSLEVDEQPSAEAGDDEPRIGTTTSFSRDRGPFDSAEVAADLDGRLSFGSIAIVPEAGMELRLDVDEEAQEITGLTAIVEDGVCQLQAFAAPKTSGLWDDIRDEIHDNLVAGGSLVSQIDGPLGLELEVRMPAQGADGRPAFNDARFIGIDGPRWFLRAVLSGNAATDAPARAHLEEFIRHTVVVRGGEPRAPREMLPLKVPDAVEQQPVGAQAGQDAQPQEQEQQAAAAPTAEDFKPFERGPEITEVR